MVALCQKSAWLFDERPEWTSPSHLIKKWEIAQLTDEKILRMTTGELLNIVRRSSQLGLSDQLAGIGEWQEKSVLRRLVRLARQTCRHEGY